MCVVHLQKKPWCVGVEVQSALCEDERARSSQPGNHMEVMPGRQK